MSGPFQDLDTAATGLAAAGFWLDTIAHNIANVNTLAPGDREPFRALSPVLAERIGAAGGPGEGVAVVGVVRAAGPPDLVYDPTHPLADAEGYVARPVVDVVGQMVDMMMASRSYQANLQVLQAARERYEASLRIGR
ncbi:MAG TPA: flagellar basal body rod protein FlgC [Actinomycetota bacterium]|nr:flagellar basal body rod protein FlgC [Actinomycetota bacterium]